MIRSLLTASLTFLLVGCIAPPPLVDPSNLAVFYTRTLETSYTLLKDRHVTRLDMDAFTTAGFAELGLHGVRLSDSSNGAETGQTLASLITNSRRLSARDPQNIIERFIEAGLDKTRGDIRFTAYLNPEELRGLAGVLQGMSGIGLQIGMHARGLIIQAVRPNSPAAQAGLMPGDTILEVNGQDLKDLNTLEERTSTLRGENGEGIHLLLLSGSELRQVRLTRVQQTVNEFLVEERLGDVGYIPLLVFDATAASHVRRAYQRLKRGGNLSGLILDLRDNGGGSVSQAQQILDLFLPTGTPLFTIGDINDQRTWQAQNRTAIPEDLPLVVLMNGNSASASELVAGALKDSGRALILGSQSLGKGTQQIIAGLPNGGALAVTTDFIYRPNGRPISYWGIMPQVCAAQFQTSESLVNAALRGALPPLSQRAQTASSAPQARRLCPTTEKLSDTDVNLALGLINNSRAFDIALTR